MKKSFLDDNNDNIVYPNSEYYFYLPLECSDSKIKIKSKFFAVKNYKTTILIEEQLSKIRVHFTDDDITKIIHSIKIKHRDFYKYLESESQKLLDNSSTSKICFRLSEMDFEISGIAFNEQFNDLVIDNPADIELYANELIFIYDLILEKERLDKDKRKPIEFIKKTFENKF